MKAIIQRVKSASVTVDGEVISEIKQGLMCLIGVGRDDNKEDVEYITRKILNLRLWKNEDGTKNWDRSVQQMDYEILFVSQFTLFAQLKGNKQSYHLAMAPELSKQFYLDFLENAKKSYKPEKIKDGRFGAMMDVQLINDGPVTIQLDSKEK
ncbi:hypothetical protein ACTFIV_009590 [Dictyostelium citrinum]